MANVKWLLQYKMLPAKEEMGVAHLTELFTLFLHSWETLAWFPKIGVFSSVAS